MGVLEGLAENAQAFMAGVARSIELQQAEAVAVASYKRRLIDYLERFMGDLVRRSDTIAATSPVGSSTVSPAFSVTMTVPAKLGASTPAMVRALASSALAALAS